VRGERTFPGGGRQPRLAAADNHGNAPSWWLARWRAGWRRGSPPGLDPASGRGLTRLQPAGS